MALSIVLLGHFNYRLLKIQALYGCQHFILDNKGVHMCLRSNSNFVLKSPYFVIYYLVHHRVMKYEEH